MTPNWLYQQGSHGDKLAHRMYRDDKLGVQCEVITRRRKNGEWMEGKAYYFIDGCDVEFRDEADMMTHLDKQGEGEVRCLCGRVISN